MSAVHDYNTKASDEDSPSRVRSRSTREEQACTCDVLWFSNATQRQVGDDRVPVLLERGGHHLGWEGTAGESVDGDVLTAET